MGKFRFHVTLDGFWSMTFSEGFDCDSDLGCSGDEYNYELKLWMTRGFNLLGVNL